MRKEHSVRILRAATFETFASLVVDIRLEKYNILRAITDLPKEINCFEYSPIVESVSNLTARSI